MTTAQGNERGKPVIKVAADGFPAGHDTPEGVACDLARAFIQRDANLFEDTCIKPFSRGESCEAYTAFLRQTIESMKQEAERTEPSPGGPQAIGKVFAARRLARDGPASYGYAVFDFHGVLFVDVGVMLHSGRRYLNRTLVVMDRTGKWYVHPLPSSLPLLCEGLNEESASTTDFSEVYQIEK
jgi:hypothetical protein